MVAVVEDGFSPPEQRRSASRLHRLVAVALSPNELGPDSELLGRLTGVEHVDLLLVTDGDELGHSTGDSSDDDDEAEDGIDGPDPGDRVRAVVARLSLRMCVHRLGLPVPVGARPRDVDDLVAAISELVGFDPEPGVGCVVPGARNTNGPADRMVGRAVERIVAAYRLPLLTYLPRAG